MILKFIKFKLIILKKLNLKFNQLNYMSKLDSLQFLSVLIAPLAPLDFMIMYLNIK